MAPPKPVLVVDDDAPIRETIKTVLEIEGYVVYAAANGREALAVLQSSPKPGLIFLDLMMPEMNGWDFADEIEKKPEWAQIPIVVLTAFAHKGPPIRQARDVERKPFELERLLEQAKRYCG